MAHNKSQMRICEEFRPCPLTSQALEDARDKLEHAVISQGAEAVFGRTEMKVDRIDEQTSWPCYKSNAMFDNNGKE
jgi:hypothetical protein